MLKTQDLSYAYDATTQLSFPDIECHTGEQWLLLGASGSGKTTLLQLLAGLRKPKTGAVQVNDTVINRLSTHALDKFRGRNIGLIFQQAHFVRSLSVEENLLLAQKLAGLHPDRQHIQEILDHLNVGHKMKARPRELSVGEQQRVSIARAVVNKPTLILADEPTSALDDQNTTKVIELLAREAKDVNATLLIVTHDKRLKDLIDKQIEL